MQNSPTPLNFTLIQANDYDANGNALLVYTFENSATVIGPFQVDKRSGLVTLRSGPAGSLDRETQDFYEVLVIAYKQSGLHISHILNVGDCYSL